MAEIAVNPWGFVLILDHDETQDLLQGATFLETKIPEAIQEGIKLGIVAASIFTPVAIPIVIAAITGYFTVQKSLIHTLDKGHGIYLTLPHAALFFAVQGAVISLAFIIPGTRPGPSPAPEPPPVGGEHFYTTSMQERDIAISHHGYISEDIACYVCEVGSSGTVPFFRLRSLQTGDHFYTTSVQERDSAIARAGYITEGISCFVFVQPAAGTVPFFRLFKEQTGNHFYTTNVQERDIAIATGGYIDEQVACYVYRSQEAGTVPLYRLHN
jgi:Repeat of unknown function (DUF5648)